MRGAPIQHSCRAHGSVLSRSGGSTPMLSATIRPTQIVRICSAREWHGDDPYNRSRTTEAFTSSCAQTKYHAALSLHESNSSQTCGTSDRPHTRTLSLHCTTGAGAGGPGWVSRFSQNAVGSIRGRPWSGEGVGRGEGWDLKGWRAQLPSTTVTWRWWRRCMKRPIRQVSSTCMRITAPERVPVPG